MLLYKIYCLYTESVIVKIAFQYSNICNIVNIVFNNIVIIINSKIPFLIIYKHI